MAMAVPAHQHPPFHVRNQPFSDIFFYGLRTASEGACLQRTGKRQGTTAQGRMMNRDAPQVLYGTQPRPRAWLGTYSPVTGGGGPVSGPGASTTLRGIVYKKSCCTSPNQPFFGIPPHTPAFVIRLTHLHPLPLYLITIILYGCAGCGQATYRIGNRSR